MRRAILITMVFAGAQVASAALLTDAVWTVGSSEDFSAYDPPPGGADPENISYLGRLLGQGSGGQRNCSNDPWANDRLAQFRGLKEGGTNNVANLQQNSASNDWRASYRPMTTAVGGDQYVRYSFRVNSQLTTPSEYSASARGSSGASNVYGSNGVPGWDVSNTMMRPHVQPSWDTGYTTVEPEWIGPEVNIGDGLWHTMDIVYNLLTGEAEWYMDSALVAALPNDLSLQAYFVGRPLDHFELWQWNNGTFAGTTAGNTDNSPAVMFDDIATYGGVPIPEPVTVVLLGLGVLPLLRGRRTV
jgi:hypothetical protein